MNGNLRFSSVWLLAILLSACSRSPDERYAAPGPETREARHRKLTKTELEKIKLDIKESDLAIYNGTERTLVSVDMEVTANPTNSASAETRRFRLFPLRGSTEDRPMIRPFTTGAVDTSDLVAFLKDKKIANREFVAAEAVDK